MGILAYLLCDLQPSFDFPGIFHGSSHDSPIGFVSFLQGIIIIRPNNADHTSMFGRWLLLFTFRCKVSLFGFLVYGRSPVTDDKRDVLYCLYVCHRRSVSSTTLNE